MGEEHEPRPVSALIFPLSTSSKVQIDHYRDLNVILKHNFHITYLKLYSFLSIYFLAEHK